MNVLIQTKPFLLSLFLVLLGILSLGLENIFYGYIDQNGVLQESFFCLWGLLVFYWVQWV